MTQPEHRCTSCGADVEYELFEADLLDDITCPRCGSHILIFWDFKLDDNCNEIWIPKIDSYPG